MSADEPCRRYDGSAPASQVLSPRWFNRQTCEKCRIRHVAMRVEENCRVRYSWTLIYLFAICHAAGATWLDALRIDVQVFPQLFPIRPPRFRLPKAAGIHWKSYALLTCLPSPSDQFLWAVNMTRGRAAVRRAGWKRTAVRATRYQGATKHSTPSRRPHFILTQALGRRDVEERALPNEMLQHVY